ncbi:MAG TPA: hypothetical protein VEN29_12470 [Casimicrobiaceae bacterium]|nr:hypothetical protein [Casimicrobiaceae bacterium]
MRLNIVAFALLVGAGPAIAMTTTAPVPPAAKTQPPATASAAAASAADDSSGLRRGTVEQVSVGGGTFHVYRQRLTFDAKSVKVFKGGKPTSIQSLRAGSNVRFTMDPTDKSHRRVAVIYID